MMKLTIDGVTENYVYLLVSLLGSNQIIACMQVLTTLIFWPFAATYMMFQATHITKFGP
jgi:hypothetical protein